MSPEGLGNVAVFLAGFGALVVMLVLVGLLVLAVDRMVKRSDAE